jgi:hypothetical protein
VIVWAIAVFVAQFTAKEAIPIPRQSPITRPLMLGAIAASMHALQAVASEQKFVATCVTRSRTFISRNRSSLGKFSASWHEHLSQSQRACQLFYGIESI